MKVTDYIAEFLIQKGITDVFGYPGGMVTHLMDSFSKYSRQISSHTAYHEQAASFEACRYAQPSGKVGVAYATSGPGATNMITGICNAYFDSLPVVFLTGQVNTFEAKCSYGMRQRGFQETDIVSMVKGVTKFAVRIASASEVEECLEKAYQTAVSGRKGPVLLDIPMDVQKADISSLRSVSVSERKAEKNAEYPMIIEKIRNSHKPCLILGAALKQYDKADMIAFADHMGLPVVTSMSAMDLLPHGHPLSYGYIGAYGSRTANFIVAKSDLLLVLGSRLDVRQTGRDREAFAPGAVIIRVDIDQNELDYEVRGGGLDILADAWEVICYLKQNYKEDSCKYDSWKKICGMIAEKLSGLDDRVCNTYVDKISRYVPENAVITADVGQNQVWVAQSYRVKKRQSILFSGGHGAMGYSLPAAIGAYYAARKPVVCFNGDGGIQMNIQELEFVRREQLPIKIFVFNNHALGMIRHFQEMYFSGNYTQTVSGRGYEAPDFEQIAKAYGIKYICYEKPEEISERFMYLDGPVLVEIKLEMDTYVYPKLEFGKANQDQEPLLDRGLYEYIMNLETEDADEKNQLVDPYI